MTRATFSPPPQSSRVTEKFGSGGNTRLQRFDRYVLSQLMVLFGFFALVLVSVYWVNRAVLLFDRLIADGHSADVFLEFTALTLPNVVGLVLPMAAFAASVYVTNRLSNESELTVVQATGYSPWRLARPYLAFGILVAVMMSLLSHILIPASKERLAIRETEISGSVSARLLREGAFLHPRKGVTFYIRDITPEGELRDILLTDRRQEGRDITYTADVAYILRDDEGTKLAMVSGLAQTMNLTEQTLSTTDFSDLTYDISSLIVPKTLQNRDLRHFTTAQMITDIPAVLAETGVPLARVLDELHGRFQKPLLCLVAALIGYAALMVGGFSRFGVTKQIVFAIFLLVVIKVVESAMTDSVRKDASLWFLVYMPTLVGLGMVVALLWHAARPFRPRRRREATS